MAELFNPSLCFSLLHSQLAAQLCNPPVKSREPHRREFEYDHKLSGSRPCKWMGSQHPAWKPSVHTVSGTVCTPPSLPICLASQNSWMPCNFLSFHPVVLASYAHGLWGHFDGCVFPSITVILTLFNNLLTQRIKVLLALTCFLYHWNNTAWLWIQRLSFVFKWQRVDRCGGKGTGRRTGGHLVQTPACHSLSAPPWWAHPAYLSLCFFICKMGTTESTPAIILKVWENVYKVSNLAHRKQSYILALFTILSYMGFHGIIIMAINE